MKLSNFKISTQLMFIMAALTLAICGSLFILMVWSLSTVADTATTSMVSIKDALEQSGKSMDEQLTKDIDGVTKDTSDTVTDLSTTGMEHLASAIVGKVQSQFEVALDTARTLAKAAEGYLGGASLEDRQRNDILHIVHGILNGNRNEFVAVWIAFESNAFDGKDAENLNKPEIGCDKMGRFIPWYYVEDGKIKLSVLEDPDLNDYYTSARDSGNEYITDPYEYAGILMVSTTVPIIIDGKTIGVAGVDLSMQRLDNTLKAYTPYETGYVYLVSSTGRFAWHRNKDLVTKKTKLSDLKGREKIAKSIQDGQALTEVLDDLTTGKEIYQVMQPVHFGRCPNAWGIVVSADRDKVMERLTVIEKSLVDLNEDATRQLTDMLKDMEKIDKKANENLATDSERARTLAIGVALTIFLLALVFAFFIGRSFSAPILRGVTILRGIAEQGDLSVEIPNEIIRRKDEIGDLANAASLILNDYKAVEGMAGLLADGDWRINVKEKSELDTLNQNLGKMLQQVNHALLEINESVKQVNTGAGEVSSAAQTLSSGAQESAASLEEITASMSEISSQTKQNAQSASQARDLAQEATKAATQGQEAMQEMTGAMERITSNSSEIQRVIKVIDDIAFQTNLLALNAAVEAARAGTHGKGFAVVAEEVRNLAARSAKAAQETTELISKSGQEIDNGGAVASKTAEVLNTIVDQIRQTTDLVAGIAVASNEQAQGVAQITTGLQQIDAVTQQNTAAAEESASAANEMSGMATNLQNLVAKFKLRP